MESTTDFVVNYDTDLILPISSYINAVQMLKGEYDVVYPFRFGNHGERKVNLGFTIETQEDMDDFENCDFVSNFLNNDFDSECFDDRYFYYKVTEVKVGQSMVWCNSLIVKYTLMVT